MDNRSHSSEPDSHIMSGYRTHFCGDVTALIERTHSLPIIDNNTIDVLLTFYVVCSHRAGS